MPHITATIGARKDTGVITGPHRKVESIYEKLIIMKNKKGNLYALMFTTTFLRTIAYQRQKVHGAI
jgi:hypothetical protein